MALRTNLKSQQRRSGEDGEEVSNQLEGRAGQGTLVTRRVSPTFELRTLYADLSDVGGGTHVVLPDFGVDAQVRHLEDQEGLLLLLLQGQQHLEEEQGRVRPGLAACLRGTNFLPPGFQS